ncbi:MAG: hypothetical protein AAB823_00300 [Patescibacteria group bacterium]
MNYKGIIIEESLQDLEILWQLVISSTKVEQVIPSHKTPWLKQWTLHTVEIDESNAQNIADKISTALDSEHNWYADFKNDKYHFIIFRDKVFKVNRNKPEDYEEVKKYGINLGIPDYQLIFSPEIEV